MSAELSDLIARVEAGEGADRGIFHEAWNVLAQIDPRFRRFACSIIDDAGTTQAGRFAALVDVGASTLPRLPVRVGRLVAR